MAKTQSPKVVVINPVMEATKNFPPNATYIATIVDAKLIWKGTERSVEVTTQDLFSTKTNVYEFNDPKTIDVNTKVIASLAKVYEYEAHLAIQPTKLRKLLKSCVAAINEMSGERTRLFLTAKDFRLRKNRNLSHPLKGKAYFASFRHNIAVAVDSANTKAINALAAKGLNLEDGESTEIVPIQTLTHGTIDVFATNAQVFAYQTVAYKDYKNDSLITDREMFPLDYITK